MFSLSFSSKKRILTLTFVWIKLVTQAQINVIRINNTYPSNTYSSCSIVLDDSVVLNAKIKYRGATSRNYAKKSFALKIVNEGGEKQDTSLLGMRSDNAWILDAMAIDKARMRNRVSTDLWNDFSCPAYIKTLEPKMHNGTHGKFVEVYLNGEYWGIYCLTEKIDRKQLKLKKFKDGTMKGALYKSFKWTTMNYTNPKDFIYDNTSLTWNGWEFSYPDLEEGEPTDWMPLVNDCKWLRESSALTLRDSLHHKFDLPVWMDYYILMDFILAEDNICKNQYVYYYNAQDKNRMMGIAPWDMDHSWGRDYKGDITDACKELSPEYNLVASRMYNYGNVPYSRKERYAQLRQTYFDADSLKGRFDKYFDLFEVSGAADRETERWNNIDGFKLDFPAEREYIHQWIDDRIAFMDEVYGFDYEDQIATLYASPTPQTHSSYSISGMKLKSPVKGLNITWKDGKYKKFIK